MQLPLQIVKLGVQPVDRLQKTRDISSGGVCFLSPVNIEVGERIEYVITLSGENPPVRIRCLGKVLRSVQNAAGDFDVAVTMERYQFVRADDLIPVPVAAEVAAW